MDFFRPEILIFPFLTASAIALFSFLSISVYVDGRRKEREAFYKSETVRRLAETQGVGAERILEVLREEDRLQARRRVEALKLGGLVTASVGLGTSLLCGLLFRGNAQVGVSLGLLPLVVGLALLLYAARMAPKTDR